MTGFAKADTHFPAGQQQDAGLSGRMRKADTQSYTPARSHRNTWKSPALPCAKCAVGPAAIFARRQASSKPEVDTITFLARVDTTSGQRERKDIVALIALIVEASRYLKFRDAAVCERRFWANREIVAKQSTSQYCRPIQHLDACLNFESERFDNIECTLREVVNTRFTAGPISTLDREYSRRRLIYNDADI